MSRRKRWNLKSPKSLPVSSALRSHSGCVLHQGILSTLSLSFHDNQASFSQDTIWTWKFKVKGKGKIYPSQHSVLLTHFLSVSHQGNLSTPPLSFHDNRASYSRDTIWPWKFKVKRKGQIYPSQHSVLLTDYLSVSHQGILSTPVPFVPWQSGLPFLRYNLTLEIRGQRSRSKVPQSAQHPVDSFP